jgi:hypothetical protein
MSEEKRELTPLEEKFKAVAAVANELINVKVDEAAKALQEACKISEEYGVPFHSRISFLSQCYTPTSYAKLFKGLGDADDFFWEFGLEDNQPNEYGGGWEHSAVCF